MLLGDLIINHDNKRIPLSAKQRENIEKNYPYYGAQGIIDYVDNYLFEGKYLLIAEDGENLRSRKQPIATIVEGKFWVNNHAHIVTSNELSNLEFLCFWLNFKQFFDLTLCNSANGGKACVYRLSRHLLYGKTTRI